MAASNNGGLVFPVSFDLETAVKKASGDADKVLKQLEVSINARPLKLQIEPEIKQSNDFKSELGSINAINNEMTDLVKNWNALSEAERIASQNSGDYTEKAKAILKRYSELVAATQSYAQSLSQISAASKKAADEELKRIAKIKAERAKVVAVRNPNMESATEVQNALKYYERYAKQQTEHSRTWDYAVQKVRQLRAALNELTATYKAFTAQDVFAMPEKSITNLNDKIKAATIKLKECVPNSVAYEEFANLVSRLKERQGELNRELKESVKTESELKAEREAANRAEIAQMRAKKAASEKRNAPYADVQADRRKRIKQLAWENQILQHQATSIEQVNRHLQIRQRLQSQYADGSAGYVKQQVEIDKLLKKLAQLKVAEMQSMPDKTVDEINAKLARCREIMGSVKFGSKPFEDAYNVSVQLTNELERQNKKLAERQRLAVLNQTQFMSNKSLVELNAKMSAWQGQLEVSKRGTKEFEEAALRVRKYNDELRKLNELIQDYQQRSFKGLTDNLTSDQIKKLQATRAELEKLEAKFNELNAAGKAYDAKGNLTADAVKIAKDRNDVLKRQGEILRDVTQADADYQRKLDEEIRRTEEAKRKADELNRSRQIKNAENKRNAKTYMETLLGSPKTIDEYNAKINALQSLLNRIDPKSARFAKYNDELRKTKEELAGVQRAISQLTPALNTMQSLTQRLQMYQANLQTLEVGTQKWNTEALNIRKVSVELERANQRLADYQAKAFRGLGDFTTDQQVKKLQNLRQELDNLDYKIHILQQAKVNGNFSKSDEKQLNQLLDQRIAKSKQISEILKSAEQLQLEREKQITEEKRKQEQLAKKLAEKQKQRNLLNSQSKDLNTLTRQLEYYRNLLNNLDPKTHGQSFTAIAEKVRILNKEVESAQKNIDALTGKTKSGADKQSSALGKVTGEYGLQESHLTRIMRRMAVYASVGMMGNFLTKVREITAEFELQKVSLGAIIRDQTRANQLFSEIKSFALKSPVQILDLTKYVKQVAAYRVETDKLFDTTRRLADVSVGLGVDMSRIVLAYGQVKAASYLRAAEIRQFTEAGIPMLDMLAEKFTKLEGHMVSTEEVMNKVQKRGVQFSMVEEIFKDMTDAGGMFYNMQEKQGNTLYGMWAKLGDAASIMYNEIGNTGIVNDGMKMFINSTSWLMRNWRGLIGVGVPLAATLAIINIRNKQATITTQIQTAAKQKAIAASKAYAAAIVHERTVTQTGTAAEIAAAKAKTAKALAAHNAAKAELVEANATNMLTRAWKGLKSAFVGNIWTIGIGVAVSAIMALVAWIERATRLGRELNKIRSEGEIKSQQSIELFNRLANEAVNAANGSKQQRDALDELVRTYKDIIPQESLTIENLRKMKGNYDALTQSISEYIAIQQKETAKNAINEEYGKDIQSERKKLHDRFTSNGMMDEQQFSRFWVEFVRQSNDATKNFEQRLKAAFESAGKDGWEMYQRLWAENQTQTLFSQWWNPSSLIRLEKVNGYFHDQREELEAEEEAWSRMSGEMGDFYNKLQAEKEKLANATYSQKDKNGNQSAVDEDSFLYQQMQANNAMKSAAKLIQEDETLKQAIQDKSIELQPEWIHLVDSVNPQDLGDITTVNFDAILNALGDKYPQLRKRIEMIRKEWGNIAPTNQTVLQIRAKLFELAKSFDPAMKEMKKYLWDGTGAVDEYLKNLKSQQEELRARLKEKQNTLKQMGVMSKWWNKLTGNDISAQIAQMEKELEALDKLVPYVTEYTVQEDKDKNKGSKSDPRLNILQEMVSTLKQINKEYDDLSKKEGATKSLADTKKIYAETFKSLKELNQKYRFGLPDFDVPTDVGQLQEYLRKINSAMEKLPKSDKAVLALQVEIDKADIDEQQRKIEAELKRLADEISRTKTAKEFFDKMLAQTGDIELATKVSLAIYGDNGKEMFNKTVEQIRTLFTSGDANVDAEIGLKLDSLIDMDNERINYQQLAAVFGEYQDQIVEKNRDTIDKIISNGQKEAAGNVQTWQKELAKAKDYEEQRTDIINRETQRRAEIIKSNLPQEEKDRLVGLSYDKQGMELADLDVKEFKGSDDFIKMFENLDNVATASLRRMREEIQRVIETDKNMSPENMKAMVDAHEKIDNAISGRGFGNDAVQSVRDYIQAYRDLKTAKQELKEAQAEYDAALPQLDADIETAKAEEIAAQEALNALKSQEVQDQNAIVSAELRLNTATQRVANAENKKSDAAKNVQKAEQKVTSNQDKQKKATGMFFNDMQQVAQTADQLASVLGDVKDILGVSEDSVAGMVFDSAIEGLQQFSKIMSVIIGLQVLYNIVTASNPWLAIASAVLAVGSMLGSFISNNKARKANEEIEKQQKIIESLEYSYGRLEKAMEKCFDSDYISNHNQQLKNLEAQLAAKQKQLEAEESKGKKTDDSKVQGYKDDIRDLNDQIADLYGTISEHFLGQDLASAARDFAEAWLDAYKEFGNTCDAMSEKFHDMMQNMVVESLIGKVMERALKPMFDMIDNMNEQDFYSDTFWKKVIAKSEQGTKDADYGAQLAMNFLEQAGISMRDLGGDLTGISRDIATASEEQITGLAAGIDTQNFYIAQQLTEVQAIRALLEANGVIQPTTDNKGYADLVELQTQAMTHLAAIERNTAENVNECRQIAAQCADMANKMGRVITTKSGTATHVINVKM